MGCLFEGDREMIAVLVVDVDDDMIGEVDYTVLNKKEMVNGRAELRPLPQKMIPEMVMGSKFAEGCVKGWNDCIDAIEGETE